MSMPSFPENFDITRDEALNMILVSIAMEELGLSHIINAEGEKLQFVLGTLQDSKPSCATISDIIEVNKSITTLLDRVMQNQMFLKSKLESVLEKCSLPVVESECCRCDSLFTGPTSGYCWSPRTYLPWTAQCGYVPYIEWKDNNPAYIRLCECGTYRIKFMITCKYCSRNTKFILTDGCVGDVCIIGQECGSAGDKGVCICGEHVVHVSEPKCIMLCMEGVGHISLEQAVLTIKPHNCNY